MKTITLKRLNNVISEIEKIDELLFDAASYMYRDKHFKNSRSIYHGLLNKYRLENDTRNHHLNFLHDLTKNEMIKTIYRCFNGTYIFKNRFREAHAKSFINWMNENNYLFWIENSIGFLTSVKFVTDFWEDKKGLLGISFNEVENGYYHSYFSLNFNQLSYEQKIGLIKWVLSISKDNIKNA